MANRKHEIVELKAKNGQLGQYAQMCAAIRACDAIDECKDIVDKSVAMAAYYAQIKDTETKIMFNRIKIRAWRRIAELFAAVDLGDAVAQKVKVQKIRAAFAGDLTVAEMSDTRIIELLRLADIADDEFEVAVIQDVTGSISDIWWRLPSSRARWLNHRETSEDRQRAHERRKTEEYENRHKFELKMADENAMQEVGVTMKQKVRRFDQVVFLMKPEVNQMLRTAAYRKRLTAQQILTRGLKMWLESQGYKFPENGEIEPPAPEPAPAPAPPPKRRRIVRERRAA